MISVDINCDMGEGMPNDEALMPYISSANIACGYHAGDEALMQKTVALALQHQVAIGAHPGFDDKQNFGRTEIRLSPAEIYELVSTQVQLMLKVCSAANATLCHVKPHGALYNMAAKDADTARAIAAAVFNINPDLVFYGLSNSELVKQAEAAGLKTFSEVFADRTYGDNGLLTPRSQHNALVEDEDSAIRQVLQMVSSGVVTSLSGNLVAIKADTICVHGDGTHAVAFAKRIHTQLQQQHIEIKSACKNPVD
ncbi:LamB/YcsF family protein [Segetibacter sp. 3557_3]|uniref:5-oxoprolinase subunit PxpA n=1 Tax=Segetibacter sp. 3557_3 TaxID=2547429 RepID=UPI001058E5AB|nr:5-oxoprolinase subunit PxpA [Segetibacter sp. 3557_3]TDH25264.1 LamB/YcsF family protein [Segetibacter sp. 3557_3]